MKYEQSCFIDWVNTEPKIIIIEYFSMQWSNTLSSWNTQFFQLLFQGFDKVSCYSSPTTILSSWCSAECLRKMIYYSLKRIKYTLRCCLMIYWWLLYSIIIYLFVIIGKIMILLYTTSNICNCNFTRHLMRGYVCKIIFRYIKRNAWVRR